MTEELKRAALADIDAALTDKTADTAGNGIALEQLVRFKACIERRAPAGSSYRVMANVVKLFPEKTPQTWDSMAQMQNILRTLRRDIEGDKLATFEALVHAAVFDDLVGQGAYYLEEGHLLAAAVVVGAALEEHLRQLAPKHGVALTTTNSKGKTVPRMASGLNDELHKAAAYSQPEWRQLQVWIDLRNEAAHAEPAFAARTASDVGAMVTGVRSFIGRYPA